MTDHFCRGGEKSIRIMQGVIEAQSNKQDLNDTHECWRTV
jgi:hypothetical protein